MSLDNCARRLAGTAVRFSAEVGATGAHKFRADWRYVALERVRLGRDGPVIGGHCWVIDGPWSAGLRRGRRVEATGVIRKAGNKLGIVGINNISEL